MRLLKQTNGWKEDRLHLSISNRSLLQLASDPADMTGLQQTHEESSSGVLRWRPIAAKEPGRSG